MIEFGHKYLQWWATVSLTQDRNTRYERVSWDLNTQVLPCALWALSWFHLALHRSIAGQPPGPLNSPNRDFTTPALNNKTNQMFVISDLTIVIPEIF